MGLPRGAILQLAGYSTSSAWIPVYQGKDREWGKQARDLLLDEWYGNCDIRGQMFDFRTLLYLDSVSIDRDGDFGILLSNDRYPTMQRIGAHRLGDREHGNVVTSGRYTGRKIKNGVIINDFGRPIAYRIIDEDDSTKFRDVQARDFIHVFNPTWHEQCRGLPVFVHALNDLRDCLQSQQWEQIAQLVISSLALVEYNEYGHADDDDARTELAGATQTNAEDDLLSTSMVGGLVRYFKSNSGGKIEQVRQDRPGDMWESFQDRLARATLAGMPWPYSFTWKGEDLNGVSVRAENLKAQKTIEDRVALLHGPAKRSVGWAISKFIKLGRLEANEEWWKWTFTRPPKLTIDQNRDDKTLSTTYELGAVNMTQIVGERSGRQLEDHLLERADECILQHRIAEEKSRESGYQITKDDLGSIPGSQNAGVDPAPMDDDSPASQENTVTEEPDYNEE